MSRPLARRRLLRLSHLDTAPLASVLLSLCCLFQVIYSPGGPRHGLVTLSETPLATCQNCVNVPDHVRLIVCLTADGRISLAASNPALQSVVRRSVVRDYGVPPGGAGSPGWLTLSKEQLPTCLVTARALSPSVTALPAFVYLYAEPQTNSADVMSLFKLLQQCHLNRLNLVAHCRE